MSQPVAEPPPPARTVDAVDVLHGVTVADPYRWLEDGDDPEVRRWTAAQNARTRRFLDALPHRGALHRRITELLREGAATAPTLAGPHLFSIERSGDQVQAVLVRRDPEARGPARVLVDPAELLGDETAALDWYSASRDGSLVAFGISTGGDERSVLRLLDVTSGELRAEQIPNTRAASVAWAPDGRGFHYTRYPAPGDVPDNELDYWRTVWWHEVGTDPSADVQVFADLPDPTAWPTVDADPSGRWLLVTLSLGWTRTDVLLLDLSTGERTTVIEGVDALTHLTWDGERLVGVTTLDADRGRVVAVEPGDPPPERWVTVLPESEEVLEGVEPVGPGLLVASTRSAAGRLKLLPRDGGEAVDVELPGVGSLAGLSGEPHRDAAFFSYTSFTQPPALDRWTPSGTEPWSDLPSALDPGAFVVEQVRYPSTDGTEVGMFLVRSASTRPGPATPTLLTGYGGFSITNAPAFGAGAVAWCEMGGVWAVACIRGGAEEGEAWHRAGMLERKQQSFDDFFAAARWLVAQGRTSPEHLVLRGGSNGGLLMGAAVTQQPDLAVAVHCAVPLLDMVRYPRFLIARLWVPEYGDPEDPEAFRWLLAYSPYHRVVDGTPYPAMLITTAEEDSRVDPCHARKFAARIQAATSAGEARPILLRIEERAGHGAGKPVTRQAEELADVLAFLWWFADGGTG